jgi:hypothetical protein
MLARLSIVTLFVLASLWVPHAGAQDPSRHPLMSIEQHRASIVKAIVDKWSDAFAVLPGKESRTADQLGNELFTLRADRLLAASLAGTYITVADLLQQSRAETAGATSKPDAKVLGDPGDDLSYTPVTPCRMVDTRVAGGALSAGVTRTFVGFAGTFASQGGVASGCGVPNGIAALSLNIAAVQPAAAGFISLWQSNVSRPAVGSAVNYAATDFATASGTIVPVNPNSNQFSAWSPAGVDIVIDVVGYFRAPTATPTALSCYTTGSNSVSFATNTFGEVAVPACAAGYTQTATFCDTSNFRLHNVGLRDSACAFNNAESSATTGYAAARCCRSYPL